MKSLINFNNMDVSQIKPCLYIRIFVFVENARKVEPWLQFGTSDESRCHEKLGSYWNGIVEAKTQ